jgi:hypothetical protein
MKTRIVIVLGLVLLMALPAAAQRRGRLYVSGPARPSPFQLVFEGAAVLPGGDLGDDFVGTEKGLGASTGFEVGGRIRYYVGPNTAVGPSVHYADFGDWNDVLVDEFGEAAYSVRTEVWRIGLDIQQFLTPRRSQIRPYLTAGLALTSNSYEDWLQGDGIYETSTTALAVGVGGGVAMGPMELSVLWTYNPVESRDLPLGEGATDDTFDWSYLSVRGGIAFGR